MKKIKFFILLCVLLCLYIFICAYSYVSAVSDNLYNSVLRLHVIANSNSKEDQNLKYIVRDKLLNYINNNSSNFSSKEEVNKYVIDNKEDLIQIAQNTVKENGFNYPVNIEFGNFSFPTKKYGDIVFPSGFYDAIKVEIGSANGKNWWCVMFPPLCFINTTTGIVPSNSKETLQKNLSEENYRLISDHEDSEFKIKFKIIELFQKSGFITAKN